MFILWSRILVFHYLFSCLPFDNSKSRFEKKLGILLNFSKRFKCVWEWSSIWTMCHCSMLLFLAEPMWFVSRGLGCYSFYEIRSKHRQKRSSEMRIARSCNHPTTTIYWSRSFDTHRTKSRRKEKKVDQKQESTDRRRSITNNHSGETMLAMSSCLTGTIVLTSILFSMGKLNYLWSIYHGYWIKSIQITHYSQDHLWPCKWT